jgi:drug/metabolite transporter (DMT)-like permease
VSLETLLSYLLAACAAGGNALANVMQRKASLEEPADRPFGLRLLFDLVRSPTWLLGFGGLVASFVLQAVALGFGQLSGVEPIITLEVPLTLLVASRVFGSKLGRPEWTGILVMTAGMIALVAILSPQPGDETNVSHFLYLAAGGGTAATIVALVVAAQRGNSIWRTACLGAAAGTSFGLTATMIKETISRADKDGVLGVVTTWQTYVAISFGILGLVLVQWALHVGPLLAAQPGFTLMDPLVSILWGSLVFGETTRSGAWLVPATLGAIAVGYGVFLLARSPVLAALAEDSDDAAVPNAIRDPQGAATTA